MFEVRSIFDTLNEADDDFEVNTDMTSDDASGGEEAPAEDSRGDQSNDDGANNEEDDFNVDTDLSAEDGGEDTDKDDGEGEGDLGGDSTDDGSSTPDDEEPIQANTDIFSSLTKEEQQLKIGELKNMFADVYSRLDDVMERINNIDPDDVGFNILSRVSSSIYRFRNYLAEYIVKVFPNKSYIENKIEYFKYLTVVNTMTSVVEDIVKEKQKEEKNQ